MSVYLNERLHPYARVKVLAEGKSVNLSCLVDTGFAGGISVPSDYENDLEFPLIGVKTWELADGSQIELGVYAGKVDFNRKQETVSLIFVDGHEGLVGIEFLKGKRFVLDLIKNSASIE